MVTVQPATGSASRIRTLSSWALRLGLAIVIGGGGAAKLAGDPAMVGLFADLGAGQWLRFVTGVLEVSGAVGLLVPRVRVLAAMGLSLLLVCAALVNLAILGASPATPLILAALTALIAYFGLRESGR